MHATRRSFLVSTAAFLFSPSRLFSAFTRSAVTSRPLRDSRPRSKSAFPQLTKVSCLSVLVHLRYIPVETPHVFPDSSSSNSDIVAFPTCIINGSAVTKTFQILYRNEEVRLESVANFKVHVVAETGKVRTKKPSIRCCM